MRIGQLARHVGVSADTIRFYERSGWLPGPGRRDNNYREYGLADVEHLRLLIDLRRLEVPLEVAAQLATWCHAGHCAQTSHELPHVIAEQRAEVAAHIRRLRELDVRLADLERHVLPARGELAVMMAGGPCCAAAGAVLEAGEGGCACCGPRAN